jgi:hypothetical protein
MHDLTMRASVGADSCIQANRKAVKESRPPANLGDESDSSSHNDEICGADFTLADSEYKINGENSPLMRLGSIKNNGISGI